MACSGPRGYHNSGINLGKRWSEMDLDVFQIPSSLSLSMSLFSAAITLVRHSMHWRSPLRHFIFHSLPSQPCHSSSSPSSISTSLCHDDTPHLKQTLEATLLVCSNMQMDLICQSLCVSYHQVFTFSLSLCHAVALSIPLSYFSLLATSTHTDELGELIYCRMYHSTPCVPLSVCVFLQMCAPY